MRLRFPLILISAVTLLLSPWARAQSVRWDPPGGKLPVGQTRALGLIFEGCSPKGEPTLPRVNGLTVQFYGQSSNTSIINLVVTQSVTLTYAVSLAKNERVEIPSFEVETDKGRLRVAAARFEPTGATVGNTGVPLDSAASAKLTATPASVWAGEVFDVSTTVEAARSYMPQFQRTFDWNTDPLLAEGWSAPEQIDFNTNGEPHVGIVFRTRALARAGGSLKLNSATHIINLSIGISPFGIFQQRQFDQFSVASNSPVVEVKPLPPKPAGFTGAVGQFKLTSKVVPATAAVGEPITWTLELSGTGNWPDIPGLPSRDVSRDFNVVQPQAKRTPAEGKIFDVTLAEDVVLVPMKAGNYTLGPVSFVYFDPKSGGYKTISTPRTAITVNAPDASKFNQLPPANDESSATRNLPGKEETSPKLSGTPPPPATLPSGTPRDPLPAAGAAAVPLPTTRLLAFCLAPFGAVLLLWAGLAIRRAQQTDPLRPRREARARALALVARIKTAGASEQRALLLSWQQDVARLWEFAHAAPSAAEFNAASTSSSRGESGKHATQPPSAPTSEISHPAWVQLWNEADRALYGPEPALPADWTARAESALAGKRVPGFSPFRALRFGNLAPFLSVVALVALILPRNLNAEEPATAYRAGKFADAEKAWREIIAKTPTDAAARHNLSLSLAQQDRWSEAAAQSAVAFVQKPADPAIRWQFALATEKAGAVPRPLAPFLQTGPARDLAARFSPSEWQKLTIASAIGAALSLGVLLLNSYHFRKRFLSWSGFTLLIAALTLALVSVFGVASYGDAVDRRAVIASRNSTLLSIPTEADTSQKTAPLNAGTLAIVDKTFLGWSLLTFENNQTGWVRQEDLVPIWR